MDTTHSFGYWMRRRRKARDLSQRELADLAACSLSAIKKIEQDTRRPSRELAEALADALAIPEMDRDLFLRSARGLAQVDEMPVASQPLVSPTVGNLPAPVGPLFGREDELEQLSDRILASDSRLITLVGPGGVGKSSLALEAARRTHTQFQDGAWFVPLASVDDPASVSTAIAVALEMTFAGPLDPEQQLLRLLQDRQILLVLDNFEQLLPEGAEVVTDLIRCLPDLSLLVTSRERLRLQAETTVSIRGLPLEPARTLFVKRAQQAGADLPEPDEDTPNPIDGIWQLVGGLPLAIELAATWTRLLSPADILSELERSLELLTGSLHDLPERHRSMQAVFEGSWARLPPDGQKLLAGLSVFAGSFTREAAESVCEATLPQLATLQDHSLIQREQGRFNLHELVRQFAANKLAAMPGEEATAKDRHAAYYNSFLGRYSDLLKTGGPDLTGWDRAIEGEMDNIRLAWRWTIVNDRPQRLLPAALALYLYLDFKGQVREGTQMTAALGECAGKALAAGSADDHVLRRTQAMALLGNGALGLRMGLFAQGQEKLRRATSLLDGLDAPIERVTAIGLQGPLAMLSMDRDTAHWGIEEILALAQREGHVWGRALALNFLGLFHFSQGRAAKARDILIESVALWSEHPGLTYCKVRSMVHLGLAHHSLDDYESAVSIQEEALRLAQEVQDYSFVPLSRCNLAFHHYAQGNLALARDGFRAALAEALRLNLFASVWHSILGLGLVAASEGASARAVTLLTVGTAQPGSYIRFLLGEPERVLTNLCDELPSADFAAAEGRAKEIELDDLLAWI